MNDKNVHPTFSSKNLKLDIVERRPWVAIVCWTAFYLGLTFSLVREKPFWNDELFTFYISHRPSLADVWNALLTGAEQIPPLFFIITRASVAVLGSSHLGFRLPEVLGFWLMSVSLFYFVRVRSSVTYGLIALTFPLVTAAYDYAYEARPYGLVLGFCALGLCCWQRAAGHQQRLLSLVGLSLSLAAAVSCHYYAVLGLAAIAAGECVRSIVSKRLDSGVWIAIVLGCFPVGLCLPLIKAAHSYSRAFWSKPKLTNVVGFYNTLLMPAAFALFLLIIGLGMYFLRFSDHKAKRDAPAFSIPFHELAAAIAFALLPVGGLLLAATVTGAFSFRYALPAVIGLSILGSWSSSVLGRQRADVGFALVLILMGFSFVNGIRAYLGVKSDLDARMNAYDFLKTQAPGTQVVIISPHLFFEISHDVAEGKGGIKPIYLADVDLALKYTDTDTVEQGLLVLEQWAPLHVNSFKDFCASHKTFFVYGSSAAYGWVTEELITEGRQLTVRASNGGQFLFLVTSRRNQ